MFLPTDDRRSLVLSWLKYQTQNKSCCQNKKPKRCGWASYTIFDFRFSLKELEITDDIQVGNTGLHLHYFG